MKLRRLLVVTGTVNTEKGAKEEHDRGMVIATNAIRKMRSLYLLRTPFGCLVDPAQAAAVSTLISATSEAVNTFNRDTVTCRLTNSMLCERLEGVRAAAVAGWLARRLREGARDVLQAQDKIVATVVAA